MLAERASDYATKRAGADPRSNRYNPIRVVRVVNQALRTASYEFIDGSYTKGTRAHTHRELIREWLWKPKGSSSHYLNVIRTSLYISVSLFFTM